MEREVQEHERELYKPLIDALSSIPKEELEKAFCSIEQETSGQIILNSLSNIREIINIKKRGKDITKIKKQMR